MADDTLYFVLRVVFTAALLVSLLLIVRASLAEIAGSTERQIKNNGYPEASATLVVVDPGAAAQPGGSQLRVRGQTSIGRHPQNDVILDDHSVSAHHATVEFDGHTWVLSDHASRNGTFVNGQDVIGQAQLKSGDFVAFGRVQTRFVC